MATRRSPDSGETRTAIVAAAHELFTTHGYHATSMRRIAAQAHVALGGIYNHFSSKEAIFVAVLDSFNPWMLALPLMRAAQGTTAEAYLRDVGQKMVALLREQPATLNLMFIELVEFEGRHLPRLAEFVLPQLAGVLARLEDFGSELRPLPTPALVRAFFGLMVSHSFTEIIFRAMGNIDRIDWLGHSVDIFLHGVIARPLEARA